MVASDETGVRIEGTNSYHWVFHCKDAVVHQPDYTRAGRVVDEVMGGHVPEVWISDRYGAQQNRGARQQTCLAHLDRDAEFAFEHGCDDLPFRFKLWFDRAFELARDLGDLAASTCSAQKRKLEKQLADMLTTPTDCDLATKLQAKIGRARAQLLTFCDYPGKWSPPTTARNASSAPASSSERSPTAIARCGPPRPKPTFARPWIPPGSGAPLPSRRSSTRSLETPRPRSRPNRHRIGEFVARLDRADSRPAPRYASPFSGVPSRANIPAHRTTFGNPLARLNEAELR